MGFERFKLRPDLIARASELGFFNPTPIQTSSIPKALAGRDIIGLAQTGTGKTAAFLFPIIEVLLEHRYKQMKGISLTKGDSSYSPKAQKPKRSIRALVLAPTRELAEQIQKEAKRIYHGMGLRSAALFGGIPQNKQMRDIKRGLDLLIACPGRLLDLHGQKLLDFSKIEYLVLDEADQMLDMGFIPDVEKIIKLLPKTRQNMMFSATMPKAVATLAKKFLFDPLTVQVDRREPTKTVTQELYYVDHKQKSQFLEQMLREKNFYSTLVFVRTKVRASELAKELRKAGVSVSSLHGNLSIGKRRQSVESFRDGKVAVLVATDIAARGIDIAGISHVVNFDVPETSESYIHRIGRTGRAQKEGIAVTMASRGEAKLIATLEKNIHLKLPVLSEKDFSVKQNLDNQNLKRKLRDRKKLSPQNSNKKSPSKRNFRNSRKFNSKRVKVA